MVYQISFWLKSRKTLFVREAPFVAAALVLPSFPLLLIGVRVVNHAEPSTSNIPVAYTPLTAVVTCAVLEEEIAHFARDLDHIVHIEVLEQGLHNEPDRLRTTVQSAIDRIETQFSVEAIVLGYGLCSRGIEGVATRRSLLIVTRAHDCITLLLGDKERYARYVEQHPGTYWYSPGWNKHHTPPGKERRDKLYREYCEKYGEENAQYLMETEQHWFNTYDRATFVDLDVGNTDQDLEYTRQCAEWLGWDLDRQCGDPALLKSLLSGPWENEHFLVLEPGQTVRLTADARIIEAIRPQTLQTCPRGSTRHDEARITAGLSRIKNDTQMAASSCVDKRVSSPTQSPETPDGTAALS